jgi:hypothetical protein
MAATAGATRGDVDKLADRLRGQGLSDTEVVEGLTGMGFTKAQARAAVGSEPAPTPTKSAPKKQQPATGAGDPSPGPGGPTLASGLTSALPSPSSLTLTPPRRLNGGDLAGFVGGLVAYTLVLNYIRFGPAGVKGWLSAKFFNRVTIATGAAPSSSSSSSSWGRQVATTLPTTKARVARTGSTREA